MTAPHRDNVPRVATRRPNDDDHAAIEITGRDDADFTVVRPVIGATELPASEDFGCIVEVKTTRAPRPFPFGRVEGDLRQLMYPQ